MQQIQLPKVDGPANQGGTPQPASEMTSFFTEATNIVTQTGQTLTLTALQDPNQIGKGISQYSANGDFYQDTGSVNAYVLSPIGSKQIPPAYSEGMRIRFDASTTNTGAATVSIGLLGVVPIVHKDGTALNAGDIVINTYIECWYSASLSKFVLIDQLNIVVANNRYERLQYYNDSGSLNAYVLDLPNVGEESPTSLETGFTVTFYPNSTNTTAATAKVGGLAITPIKNYDGSVLTGNEIKLGFLTTLIYVTDHFRVVIQSSGAPSARLATLFLTADQGFIAQSSGKPLYTVLADTFNIYDTVNNRMLAPVGGFYRISGKAEMFFQVGSGGGLTLVKNGTPELELTKTGTPNSVVDQSFSIVFLATQGDIYEPLIITQTASDFDIFRDNATTGLLSTYLTIEYLGT